MSKIAKNIVLVLVCSLISYYLTLTIDKTTLETRWQFAFVFVYFLVSNILIYKIFLNRIQNRNKKNSIFRLIASGILAVLLLVCCFDSFIGLYKPMTIRITAVGNNEGLKEGQRGTEVWLKQVMIDNEQVDLSEVPLTDGWEYRDGFLLSYQNQPNTIVLHLPTAKSVTLRFLSHPWSGTVIVDNGYHTEKLDLFNPDEAGSFVDLTLKGVQKIYSFHDIFIIFCSFVLLLSVFYILLGMKKIKLLLEKMYQHFNTFAPSLGHKVVYLFVSCISSFCFVGNYVLLNYGNGVIHIIAVFLFAVLILFTLGLWLFKFIDNKRALKKNLDGDSVFWNVFIITSMIWFFYLIAFYPGFMSGDSIDQWKQALTNNYNDWHPVIHTLLIKAVQTIWNHPAAYSILQILIVSAILSYTMNFLYLRGLPKKVILIFSAVFACIPSNGVYVITMWKDIPFSYALLFLTVLIANLLSNYDLFWRRRVNLLLLTIALILTATMRHNGIIPFIFSILLIIGYSVLKRKYIFKNIILVVITLSLIIIYKGPVFDKLDVTPNPKGLKYYAPVHGIARLVYEEKNLSPETEKFLINIMPLHMWTDLYNDYTTGKYTFGFKDFVENLSKHKTSYILNLYIQNLIKYPDEIIKERLIMTQLLWSVQPLSGSYNYRYQFDGITPNKYGFKQVDNPFKTFINEVLSKTSDSGFLDILLWRSGIYFVSLLYLSYYLFFFTEKRNLCITIPLYSNILALLLSLKSQNYRYVYFVFLLFCFIILYSITCNDTKIKKTKDE